MEHPKKPKDHKDERERRSKLRFSDLHRLADDAVDTHIHGKKGKTGAEHRQHPEKRN